MIMMQSINELLPRLDNGSKHNIEEIIYGKIGQGSSTSFVQINATANQMTNFASTSGRVQSHSSLPITICNQDQDPKTSTPKEITSSNVLI
jgi:hypothetical protein